MQRCGSRRRPHCCRRLPGQCERPGTARTLSRRGGHPGAIAPAGFAPRERPTCWVLACRPGSHSPRPQILPPPPPDPPPSCRKAATRRRLVGPVVRQRRTPTSNRRGPRGRATEPSGHWRFDCLSRAPTAARPAAAAASALRDPQSTSSRNTKPALVAGARLMRARLPHWPATRMTGAVSAARARCHCLCRCHRSQMSRCPSCCSRLLAGQQMRGEDR
ncbi:hypothetical protein V8C86DRAFT_2631890 [Haematococcus lacustris]